jgi:hypothetical protein
VTEARQSHGTIGAVVFVVGLCCAGAVFLLLSIPLIWAILTTLGLAEGAVRMVRDIRGNRGCEALRVWVSAGLSSRAPTLLPRPRSDVHWSPSAESL